MDPIYNEIIKTYDLNDLKDMYLYIKQPCDTGENDDSLIKCKLTKCRPENDPQLNFTDIRMLTDEPNTKYRLTIYVVTKS